MTDHTKDDGSPHAELVVSPTTIILDWLARQDLEAKQTVLFHLQAMGIGHWLRVECSPDDIESSIESLRQAPSSPMNDVGVAVWLRGLISFMVEKMGDPDWSVAERVNANMLESDSPSQREIAKRFFDQKPLREKRWQRVLAEWRALVENPVSDAAMDAWLTAVFRG